MQLRVVIDGRPLVGNRTGIGVHTAEIARRLTFEPPPLIASHAAIENREGIETCRFQVDAMPFGVLWQQLVLPRIDADVLWGPHGTLPLTWRKSSLITMHDLTSITMPGRHQLKTIASFNLFVGRSLEQATKVACVSRATADETMRGFGVPRSKIEIVPNGVDDFFTPGGEERDYVLYAGTLEPRKGIGDLLAAWRSLPAPRPRLVLCGDPGWRTKVSNDPEIEVRGYVTRSELRDLYREALVFVYPSHYEGFGLPPLEAMACGAPVVATRTGAIPEFAGDAALLVAPGDVEGLAKAIGRLVRDRAFRTELRLRAADRARLFGWDRSGRLMQELLEAVACA